MGASRYITREKVEAAPTFKAVAMNLLKHINLAAAEWESVQNGSKLQVSDRKMRISTKHSRASPGNGANPKILANLCYGVLIAYGYLH